MSSERLWIAAAPGAFILLWSSAFVAISAGLPDVSPLLFLTLRFGIAASALLALSLALGLRWDWIKAKWRDLAWAGFLINALYLSGAYLAMQHVTAATMAVIGSLHPVMTAVIAACLIGERLRRLQWLGLAIGILGVLLVVWEQAALPASYFAAGLGGLGVIALALGTVHYRGHCREVPLREANLVQLSTAFFACALLTGLFEDVYVVWTPRLIATLLYLSLIVSLGAMLLLFLMLRHGAAGKVASNFYLTPATTALLGFLLLGDSLTWQAVAGFAVASLGVWLAQRGGPRKSTPDQEQGTRN